MRFISFNGLTFPSTKAFSRQVLLFQAIDQEGSDVSDRY
jgi:hypothetical protein